MAILPCSSAFVVQMTNIMRMEDGEASGGEIQTNVEKREKKQEKNMDKSNTNYGVMPERQDGRRNDVPVGQSV